MRRISVLHVGKFYPPVMGGMETCLRNLCLGLRGHAETKVLVSNSNGREVREIIDGVPVVRLPMLTTLASTPLNPRLVSELRCAEADIIHIHLPNPMAVLAAFLARPKARFVLSHHSDIVRQRALGLALSPLHHWIRQRASAILATSPNYLESSAELSPYRKRCHVIPFGIPLPKPDTAEREAARDLRTRYGAPIVLAVGRLVYYKGFEYLIRAIAKVPAQLLIVGSGPLRADLEREAQAVGVAERVHLLGSVPEIGPLYEAADVFVLPSIARSEAFGIVQLEAMARGKPVINTALASGVPFVSLHGVTGITVPPADSSALADALNLILQSPELCARFGSAGQSRVAQDFSVERMIESTLAVYEQVLNGDQSTLARSRNFE